MAPPPRRMTIDYGQQLKLARANFILGNYQLLIRYASANHKSVPQTRYYFEKVAAGYAAEPVILNWFDEDK